MKAGFVALVGLPNAGKSTLTNAMVGEKVGIISPKPQTTRKRVIGILTEQDVQMCLIDSPGKIDASQGLNKFLKLELQACIEDADVVLAVLNLDARKMQDLETIVQMCKSSGKPWAAVITKTDLDPGHREPKLREMLAAEKVPVFAGSALKRPEAMKELLFLNLAPMLPKAEQFLYEPDTYTTQSLREILAELVREKCFEYLHEEVPYGMAVRTLKFTEPEGKPAHAYVEILVTKDNHVSIVVGKKGDMLKKIGQEARLDFERISGMRLFLETHVKVRPNWAEESQTMKELGYAVTN